jgi:predicted RNA-binding protein with PUA-like domain
MPHWLLKTEPSTFSFADLQKAKKTAWDGVTNPAALKNIRAMQPGDLAIIYHTGDEKHAVGLATISSAAYADPKQKDEKLVVMDISAGKPLAKPVPLATIKADKLFADSPLVTIGRLSVVPLTDKQYAALLKYSGA